MPLTGREVHLLRYPMGEIRESDFGVVEAEIRSAGPGEVLVRNTWTSVDPGMRLRLRTSGPAGYFNAFPLNASLDGVMAIGEVVESRVDGFRPGDTVWHAYGWRDFAVVRAGEAALGGIGTLARVDAEAAPAELYLGLLGGMGLTAYIGLIEVATLGDSDVVWVSAAAGAVGGIAAQIAKIRGNYVIGSAGSDEKVAYLLDELGLDAAFNYRSRSVAEGLREAAPGGIDVYFDNVGGDHLEAALMHLRRWGRVAMCGAISEYDAATPTPGPNNLFQAVANDLTLRGFRGSSYAHRMAEVQQTLRGWLQEGKLQYRDTVVEGLDRAPQALLDLMNGRTIGKTLVRVA